MRNNIITQTDSYKLNHWNQYPDGTQFVYSYFESRIGARFNNTVFFGLQYILKEYFEGRVINRLKLDWARKLSKRHFASDKLFNLEMWEYILDKYDGRLPLRIRAVPEGTHVTTGNVLMTIENTDPKCFSLTNAVESLLTHTWSSSTVATIARECKRMFKYYLDITSDNSDGINYMLHDFGFRGVSSSESAAMGGAGHLLSFFGTDTVPALELAHDYYGADLKTLAFSVPATEHSVMTSMGIEGEEAVFASLLKKYPNGVLSVVADSYDIYNFVENYVCRKYKDRILSRKGKLVIRPDSVTPNHKTPQEEILWILNTLWQNFGGHVNSKGYKVLNPCVGILWGDGLDAEIVGRILEVVKLAKFSVEPLVFGMGGGLLQRINRDIQRFAFKSSAQMRDNIWYDIQKQPRDVSKASKRGKLKLVKTVNDDNSVEWLTVPFTGTDDSDDQLVTVFENGVMIKEYTFDEVRENAKI